MPSFKKEFSTNPCKPLANLKSPFIMTLKLRKEVVLPQKLSSEPCMVEVGKGKQEERVPEQSLRSVYRVDYVETALRERESASGMRE